MAISNARSIGCMFGAPTTTSVPFVVCSLVTGDITVSVAGASDTVTPLSIGGGIGYVINGELTGLSPLTRYQATITQGGNTETQYFWTAPESGDDFCFAFASCDNNTRFNVGQNASFTHSIHGAWRDLRALIDANGLINGIPCIGVFWCDDHGYVDLMNYNRILGESYTALDTPTENPSEANYAVAWLSNFGLYSTADDYAEWGRDEDRMWCYANLNRFPQWGDHEFKNDIGWDNPKGHIDYVNHWTHGKTCWDAFMAPLQGTTAQSVDTTANHWYLDLGDVRLLAPDSITNSDASVSVYSAGSETAVTTLYGAGQIDDILTAANSSHAFKVLGLNHSLKYMSSTASGETDRGGQHAIKEHCIAEFQRLFTRTNPGVGEPDSLMANSKTNGADGALVVCHGDHHNGHIIRHADVAYTNNAAEWVYEIGSGSVNGSGAQVPDKDYTEVSYDGSYCEYYHDDSTNRDYHIPLLTVYGSRFPKEMHVSLRRYNSGVVWNKRFVHRNYRNDAVDVDKPISDAKPFSDGAFE